MEQKELFKNNIKDLFKGIIDRDDLEFLKPLSKREREAKNRIDESLNYNKRSKK